MGLGCGRELRSSVGASLRNGEGLEGEGGLGGVLGGREADVEMGLG